MKRLYAAIAISILSTAALAQAQRVDFKGLPMGSTIEQVKAAEGLASLHCMEIGDPGSNTCWTDRPETTYAGQIVKTLSAELMDGKLVSVGVETLGGTGELIEQALIAKYGRAKSRYKVPKALKNGVKYQMTVTKWQLVSGDEISIQDHPKPVDQVFIEINSSTYVKWRKGAQKLTKKEKQDV